MNLTSDYPLGLHPWYFPDNSCQDPGSQLRSLLLQQAVEVPGKFCCDTGACIESSLVCDQNKHCDDQSDEEESLCQTVETGQHYRTNKPPKTSYKHEGSWSSINPSILVDVAIEYLMDLSEEEASMTVLFNTRLAWRDFRLTYTFLKAGMGVNSITENLTDLWTPDVGYSVLLSSRLVSRELLLRRNGQPSLQSDYYRSVHPKGKNCVCWLPRAYRVTDVLFRDLQGRGKRDHSPCRGAGYFSLSLREHSVFPLRDPELQVLHKNPEPR